MSKNCCNIQSDCCNNNRYNPCNNSGNTLSPFGGSWFYMLAILLLFAGGGLDLVAFGETIIRYLVAVDLIMLGAIVLELTTTLVLETLVVIIFLTVTLPALLVVFLQ